MSHVANELRERIGGVNIVVDDQTRVGLPSASALREYARGPALVCGVGFDEDADAGSVTVEGTSFSRPPRVSRSHCPP